VMWFVQMLVNWWVEFILFSREFHFSKMTITLLIKYGENEM
jgi:hypothetical protein